MNLSMVAILSQQDCASAHEVCHLDEGHGVFDFHAYIHLHATCNIHTWSESLVPMVNIIKGGCENKCAFLILLILFLNHKNLI